MVTTQLKFKGLLLTLCAVLILIAAPVITASADEASIQQQIDDGVTDFTVTTYSELQTLFRNCNGNYNVKLGAHLKADLDGNGSTYFSKGAKNVSLDLNGYAINVTKTNSISGNQPLFLLWSYNNLTIKDSVGNGGLYMIALRDSQLIFWLSGFAALTIDSGRLRYAVIDGIKSGNAIYLNSDNSSFTMNGGLLESTLYGRDEHNAMISNAGGSVVINGGTLTSAGTVLWSGNLLFHSDSKANTTINGGTFNSGYDALKVNDGTLKVNGGIFNIVNKYSSAIYYYSEYLPLLKTTDWLGEGINVFINGVKTTLPEQCYTVKAGEADSTVVFTTEASLPTTEVSSVSITDFDIPNHNGKLDTDLTLTSKGVTITDVSAYHGKYEVDSFSFGDTIDLYITVKFNEGYTFASNMVATLEPHGGEDMTCSYYVKLNGGSEIRFIFTGIRVQCDKDQIITTAALTIAAPKAGNTPAVTATAPNLRITDVVWSPADASFKDGTDYTVTVTIRAAEGYLLPQTVRALYEKSATAEELAFIKDEFDRNFPLSATVNGETAAIDASKATLNKTKNDSLYATAVVYTFSAAADPKAQKPSITVQPKGGSYTTETTATLSVTASTADSGKLSYQWYRTSVNDISTISAIYSNTDAGYGVQQSFTPPQEVGTAYYCVMVTNTLGSSSESVYSTLVPVTYLHTHKAEDAWKSDDTNHWKECSCGEKMDVAAHTYGEWTTLLAATETKEGVRQRTCSICGFNQAELIAKVTVTPTAAPTKAATPTVTPTKAATPTVTPTKAATPTAAPTKAATPTAAPTKAATPTAAPTKAATPTVAPTATATPVPTTTATPVTEPTDAAAPTLTTAPDVTATPEPTAVPEATATPEPEATPTTAAAVTEAAATATPAPETTKSTEPTKTPGTVLSEVPTDETITDIEIPVFPTKVEYEEGDTLDLDGMVVRLLTDEGYIDVTSGFKVTEQILTEEGTQAITVSYGEHTATFNVTVKKAESGSNTLLILLIITTALAAGIVITILLINKKKKAAGQETTPPQQ